MMHLAGVVTREHGERRADVLEIGLARSTFKVLFMPCRLDPGGAVPAQGQPVILVVIL